MPIFEYQCDSCGHTFELLLLKNSPTPECPECHGQQLTKLLSLPTVSSPSSKIRAYFDYERRKADQTRARNMEHDHSHDHDHDH